MQKTLCFLEKFTQLAQILHDRRSRQILSLLEICPSFTMKSIFWTLQLSQTALDDDICASLCQSSESPFPRFTVVFQVNLTHYSRAFCCSNFWANVIVRPSLFAHIVPGPSTGGESREPSCLLMYQKQFILVFVHNFSAIIFSSSPPLLRIGFISGSLRLEGCAVATLGAMIGHDRRAFLRDKKK